MTKEELEIDGLGDYDDDNKVLCRDEKGNIFNIIDLGFYEDEDDAIILNIKTVKRGLTNE